MGLMQSRSTLYGDKNGYGLFLCTLWVASDDHVTIRVFMQSKKVVIVFGARVSYARPRPRPREDVVGIPRMMLGGRGARVTGLTVLALTGAPEAAVGLTGGVNDTETTGDNTVKELFEAGF